MIKSLRKHSEKGVLYNQTNNYWGIRFLGFWPYSHRYWLLNFEQEGRLYIVHGVEKSQTHIHLCELEVLCRIIFLSIKWGELGKIQTMSFVLCLSKYYNFYQTCH